MISAERFLEQQDLQPVLSEAGGSALSHGGRLQDGRIKSGCGQVLCNDEENTPKRSRHARHAGRVVAGVSRTPDDPNDLDACREAALRLLDAAPRPSGAMRERLVGKGYAPEVVDDVIARLIRVRLIDDEAYAQSAVRYCASRLMGYRGAVMELKRKGVDRQLAQHVCDEAESQGVFAEAAWELGRRTARKTAGLDVEVRKRRFWSAGGRKGHDPEVLREIAQELFA
ncbi:RecX family transcriptional regulator [Bifidobacterium catenulatum subsp. kashiwanohense]|uniref:Regulatory protein RecX n=1 Tax=Bifidobacterium catenulatum subsp. kashiwanohense TaxID=630129 RepID=A0AAJ1UNN3_9BIFI|nr:regulatory protein RecX [Bifidobacterium catenulatum]MDH7900069.1 RecX family transcriptional regulator [Bifidobacterium catenulatum subsp. kashiwanohense]